jgi:5,6-dimethylbenzimidazole synthase
VSDSPFRYSEAERAAVYRVIAERRDMRHFKPGAIDTATLQRLLSAAHRAPSVGLMQPWRFVRIVDSGVRRRIYDLVQDERLKTAAALEARQEEFLRLKVQGILECGEVLVAALCEARERHVFGRRTLPEMDLASVACAIQNLWLAARAEGLGMGWVSMFDPAALADTLSMPEGALPVGILCLGHVEAFYSAPMLELTDWARSRPLDDLVFQDRWGAGAPGE